MSLKDAVNNLVTAMKFGDFNYLLMTSYVTLASSKKLPRLIRHYADSKIRARSGSIVKFSNVGFLVHDPACMRILTPSFEERTRRILLEHDIQNFIDVGAHIGKYTIPIAKKGANVIAVEPDPENFRYLRYNVVLNRVSERVKLVNCACFNKSCFLKLYVEANSDVRSVFGNGRYVLVRAERLDDIVRRTNFEPDFIKIDVEGAEREVLEGAKNTLKKHHPQLVVEVSDRTSDCVIRYLKRLGYKCRILERIGPVRNLVCWV